MSRVYGKIMLTISIKFIVVLCSREKTIPALRGRYLSTNSNRSQDKGRAKGGSEITVERTRAARTEMQRAEKRERERPEKRATVFPTYLPKVYLELRKGYDVVEENSLRKSGIKCLSCAHLPSPPLHPLLVSWPPPLTFLPL